MNKFVVMISMFILKTIKVKDGREIIVGDTVYVSESTSNKDKKSKKMEGGWFSRNKKLFIIINRVI